MMKYHSYDYVILYGTVNLPRDMTLDEWVGPKISPAQSRRVREVGNVWRSREETAGAKLEGPQQKAGEQHRGAERPLADRHWGIGTQPCNKELNILKHTSDLGSESSPEPVGGS